MVNTLYELSFLKSLLITILIEMSVLLLVFKCIYKSENIKNDKLIFTGILPSIATLPYLWFVLPAFIQSRTAYIVIGESAIIVLESVIIMSLLNIKFTKAFLVSFLCNMISFVSGLIIPRL